MLKLIDMNLRPSVGNALDLEARKCMPISEESARGFDFFDLLQIET